MVACYTSNKCLLLLIDLVLSANICLAMTWVEWLPTPGYRMGVSDEKSIWNDIQGKCQQYGAVPPQNGVEVDIGSDAFNSFMASLCPNEEFCWLGNSQYQFGACQGLAAALGSDSVYPLYFACRSTYRYICYGPIPAETTQDAELPTTTIPMTTTPPTTEPSTTVPATTVPSTTVPASSITPVPVSNVSTDTSSDVTASALEDKTEGNDSTGSVTRATPTASNGTTGELGNLTDFTDGTKSVTSNMSMALDDTTGKLGDSSSFTELSWNQWTQWSVCTSSCNGGQKLRLTLCAGKLECRYQLTSVSNLTISYDVQWSVCNTDPCPVDGLWMMWSEWSRCSGTCGLGTRHRTRLCDGPYYGGMTCTGNKQENEYCDHEKLCPGIVIGPPVKEETFTKSDSRPSAIGVGVISLAFVLMELALILLMDSATIAQYCRQRLRRKQYDHHTSRATRDVTDGK